MKICKKSVTFSFLSLSKVLMLICMATLLIFSGKAVYADENLAIVQISTSGITAQNVSNGDLALTLSGNTGVYEQADISVGGSASLTDDNPLPDGQYKYELRTITDSYKDALVQNGHFQIISGAIVVSSTRTGTDGN